MLSIKSIKIQRSNSSVITIEELGCHSIEAFQEILKFCDSITANIIPASSEDEPDLLDMAFVEESNSPNQNAEQEAKPKSGSSSYNRDYYQKKKDDPDYKAKCKSRSKEYYEKVKNDPEYKRKKSEDNKRRRQEKKNQNTVTIQAEI